MTPSTRPRLFLRLVPVLALLLALVVAVGPVAAAAPTVAANPALVPFSAVPGQPGVTTVTFAANGTTGLTACGQDNAVLPTFPLGAVDPNTPLVVNFPFIQAGKYTFWVSADSACTSAKLVQATATRLGPTGKAGVDDIVFKPGDIAVGLPTSSPTSNITTEDVVIHGAEALFTPQKFPIPGVQLCFMSGDGAQVDVPMKVGQDSRPVGLGTAAATTTVLPLAGQNGCFAIPWIVNGGYTATIARSGASATYGFCAGAGAGNNAPSVPPTATIGKCAQVAFNRRPDGNPYPSGTVLNGSIVTGADNHAVQVCVSAFSPGAGGTPVQQLANTVNAYNKSGAVNLTPLTIEFPSKTVIKVETFDITGPGPGGQGGAQFACQATIPTQSGSAITAISTTPFAGATTIDVKFYFIL